ncbi:ABC transporter substrate-binding protein [Actinomadura sp. CNU-125]|uniref:ABC transporter substrate-binding protein n=1 Tax=Actinomadura sp. CNU-125 TaxID=1904961 RepID=UPI00095EDAC8|nr:ABC transporter substrate-binding protein [Actinomadura sp. CNU-125]OLT34661.1 ABC transporter substrate-binding protein [Actinomadura sp. CNU-125]
MKRKTTAALAAPAAAAAIALAAGCTVAGNAAAGDGSTSVVVGYQSKTINTVTAGTLLRSLGYFEKRLGELGKSGGRDYEVVWKDYETGASITAQMLAGKIDIGSMGDYPLLINGTRSQGLGADARTELVSVTGYNMRGSLNGVVVAADSPARSLADLKGKSISASVGSAGHGTLVQALGDYGLKPDDVTVENQEPSVGASALQAGSAAGLAQFVAWPGLLVQQNGARLLYDGGALDVPTFHGVVVPHEEAEGRPEVLRAFLRAQIDATRYLHEHPVEAAESVAAETGLPAETVYLYNGAGGVATFDTTIKPRLREALGHDVPFLKSIGVLKGSIDLESFVDDGHIRQAYGSGYDEAVASTANPAAIKGTDRVCDEEAGDPAKAGEVWVAGEKATRPAASPVCLLRNVRDVRTDGGELRAAYVPDATTGTRWFADRMTWVENPEANEDERFEPFATVEQAREYIDAHSGSKTVSYEEAVKRA